MLLTIYDILIIVVAVIILGLHAYTYYNKIFKKNFSFFPSFLLPYTNNLRFLKFVPGGAIVPYGNAVTGDAYEGATTVVELSDADLNELLQILFAEIGNSNLISIELLQSLGLYTDTVVSVLTAIGYTIY